MKGIIVNFGEYKERILANKTQELGEIGDQASFNLYHYDELEIDCGIRTTVQPQITVDCGEGPFFKITKVEADPHTTIVYLTNKLSLDEYKAKVWK